METYLHQALARACERARVRQCAVVLSGEQYDALLRIPRRRRKGVRRLALSHPYLADLLVSFPAALFVMAHGNRMRTTRGRCLACAGAPLRVVAEALGIGLWMRKVPSAALRPELLLDLPKGVAFSAQIGNLFPVEQKDWPIWLAAMHVAGKAMDDAFALWLARELRRYQSASSTIGFASIGLWAWYGAGDRGGAGSYITQGWQPDMSLGRAAELTRDWLEGLGFALFEEPGPLGLSPPANDRVGVFEFAILRWGAPLVSEGHMMRNCLAIYADSYVSGSRVWSVRKSGKPVADLELDFEGTNRGVPRLSQLYAVNNSEAGEDVWAAAYQWLSRWQALADDRPIKAGVLQTRMGAWIELWRPYWDGQGYFAPGIPHPIVVSSGYEVAGLIEEVRPLTWLQRRR